MKSKLLKLLVLALSMSAAGMYVWHAARTKPAQGTQTPATKNDFTEPMDARVVTEEEVKATRERMLRSSKSGIIMSDADIRSMLESQPEPEKETTTIKPGTLMGSSKNPHRVIRIEEVREIVQPGAETEKKPDANPPGE